MEKRTCLVDSSWIGGEAGRFTVGVVVRLEKDDLGSLGGVAGGAGTGSAGGPISGTGPRPEGSSGDESGRAAGCLLAGSWSITVCRRMSDSLAMMPRRRRKGMIAAAGVRSRSC